MRGHRPIQRGSTTRRRRTLDGGPPPQSSQLSTIVESPAPLNPNHPHWWRRRASIDSSGSNRSDGQKSEVSSISTSDTRKRFGNVDDSNKEGSYKTAQDGHDDDSIKSSSDEEMIQQTIMVVHSMPSKVPAKIETSPRTPPQPSRLRKSNSSQSFPPPTTPTHSAEQESDSDHAQQLTPPISNLHGGHHAHHTPPTHEYHHHTHHTSRSHSPGGLLSPPQDRSDRSGSTANPRRRPSIGGESVNSISFIPDKDEEHDDSYSSEESEEEDTDSGMADVDVMDLRPSQGATWDELSMDSELASGLFQVSGVNVNSPNESTGKSTKGSSGHVHGRGSGMPLGTDLPTHWNAASTPGVMSEAEAAAAARRAATRARRANVASSGDLNASFATAAPGGRLTGSRRWSDLGPLGSSLVLGESEQAYRALMSLMGQSPGNSGTSGAQQQQQQEQQQVDTFHPGLSSTFPTSSGGGRSSMMSVASQSSGFWSAMGDWTETSSVISADDDDTVSSSKKKTRKRQLRQVYVRRCARAMVTLVVLATLSCTALYFIVDETERSSIMASLPIIGKSQAQQQEEDVRDLYFEGGGWDAPDDDEYREERIREQDEGIYDPQVQDQDTVDNHRAMILCQQRAQRLGSNCQVHAEQIRLLQAKRGKEERVKARREQRRAQRLRERERALSTGTRIGDAEDAARRLQGEGTTGGGYDYYAGEEWQQQHQVLGYGSYVGDQQTIQHPLSSQEEWQNHQDPQGGYQQAGEGVDYYTGEDNTIPHPMSREFNLQQDQGGRQGYAQGYAVPQEE